MKDVIERLMYMQHELTSSQTEISVEIRTFQSRLARIEDILLTLRHKLAERFRAAQESEEQLKTTQFKVDDLQDWFYTMASKMN